MTMMKREPDSIWNRVREDRDVDDLIFGEEFSGYREKSQPCSERRAAVWTDRSIYPELEHRSSYLPNCLRCFSIFSGKPGGFPASGVF